MQAPKSDANATFVSNRLNIIMTVRLLRLLILAKRLIHADWLSLN